jgi:hypothetical protein
MDSVMNNEDRLNLQKMIKANDVEDQTGLIRQARHSSIIGEQVKEFLFLKNKYPRLAKSNPNEFEKMCLSKCSFLFNNYTDIYNKLYKDELDLDILNQFLTVLRQIEDGKIDQHEGSYKVGQLLKKIYIDSALKKADKLDAADKKKNKKGKKDKKSEEPREISWKEYKASTL